MAPSCVPVTAERWADLVALFERPGPRGGTPMPGSCWCMWWRQRSGDGPTNKKAMSAIVKGGQVPGLLAYEDGEPAGWVSVAPREDYGQLMRSRAYGPREDDDSGVFAIVCFYIDPRFKRRGISKRLLDAAVEHARQSGASAVEAYPHASKGDYMGSLDWYADAGFQPVREAGKRQIVRLSLDGG